MQPVNHLLTTLSRTLLNTRNNNKSFDNLTNEEWTALKKLRSNNNIVVKPADKGNAVVVMIKSAYIQEVERQLGELGDAKF